MTNFKCLHCHQPLTLREFGLEEWFFCYYCKAWFKKADVEQTKLVVSDE